jgi:hypothetical protein
VDAIGENYGGVQVPFDDRYVMFSPTVTREYVSAPNGPFGVASFDTPEPMPLY